MRDTIISTAATFATSLTIVGISMFLEMRYEQAVFSGAEVIDIHDVARCC